MPLTRIASPERLTVAASLAEVMVIWALWKMKSYEHETFACAAPGASAAKRAARGMRVRRFRMTRKPARAACPHPVGRSADRWRRTDASAAAVAQRRAGLGRQQQHAGLGGRPEDQHLGAHRADLARREVHDADDEPPLELPALVVLDLRARALDPDLVAEVDAQLPRGLARLWEVLHLDDAADAHVDGREVVEVDLPHYASP